MCSKFSLIAYHKLLNRKSILKGLHNFIHLNLTIALALALLVFVTGIETATESDVSVKNILKLYCFHAVLHMVGWLCICGIFITLLLYCCVYLDVV